MMSFASSAACAAPRVADPAPLPAAGAGRGAAEPAAGAGRELLRSFAGAAATLPSPRSFPLLADRAGASSPSPAFGASPPSGGLVGLDALGRFSLVSSCPSSAAGSRTRGGGAAAWGSPSAKAAAESTSGSAMCAPTPLRPLQPRDPLFKTSIRLCEAGRSAGQNCDFYRAQIKERGVGPCCASSHRTRDGTMRAQCVCLLLLSAIPMAPCFSPAMSLRSPAWTMQASPDGDGSARAAVTRRALFQGATAFALTSGSVANAQSQIGWGDAENK